MSKSRDLGEFPAAALDIDASGNLAVTGDVSLADNDKLILGTSSDLQIYHDGANSYITETGTGNLYITASDSMFFQSSDNTHRYAEFVNGGAVKLRFDNSDKMQTTAAGIDVTGTVTADGLTVSGATTGFLTTLANATASGNGLQISAGDNSGDRILQLSDKSGAEKLRVTALGNVGIGVSDPDQALEVNGVIKTSLGSGGSSISGYASPDLGYFAYNYFNNNGTETVGQSTRSSHRISMGNGGTNAITFDYRAPNAAAGTWSERMRIAANGSVALGPNLTATPNATSFLDIRGGRTIQIGKNSINNYYGSSIYMSVDIGSTEGAWNFGTRYTGTEASALVFEVSSDANAGRSGDVSGLNYVEKMRISSAGHITTPAQPAFHAVGGGSWVTMSPGTTTIVTGWASVTARGAYFNTLDGKFFAAVSGWYSFTFNAYTRGDTDSAFLYPKLRLNGASDFGWTGNIQHLSSHSAADMGTTTTVTMYMTQNDFVQAAFSTYNSNCAYHHGSQTFSGYLIG